MLRTGFETTNRKEGRRLLGLTVRMAASNSLNAFRFIVAMLPLWRFPGSLYGKALSDAFWCRSKQLFCTEPSKRLHLASNFFSIDPPQPIVADDLGTLVVAGKPSTALSAVRKCKGDGIGIVLVSNDLRSNKSP